MISILVSEQLNYATIYRSKLTTDSIDNKKSWKVINDIVGRCTRGSIPDSFYVYGNLVSDPEIITNEFNRHFTYVGESLARCFTASDDFAGYLNAAVNTRFVFKPATCGEITKIVTSFESSSPGIEDLPMQLYLI